MTSDAGQFQPPRNRSGQRIVCVLVGSIFVAAAVLKAVRPEDFLGAIRASFELEATFALIIGALVVALEIGAGMALFMAPLRRVGAFAAMMLLAAFTVYLIGFHSPEAPSCGCLGVASSSPVGSSKSLGVARNIAMLIGLALVIPSNAIAHSSKGEQYECRNRL